ncbi:MAG: hypothetical protein JWO38_1616 [Gemmataceae bacterium]|nr:hypothetical protein [Gemmataceae bacterium]
MKMTCDEFRQLLGDHLGGELVVEVRESFETHRVECENCEFYLESYTHTVKITRKLPKCGPLPSAVEARLREVLKDHLHGSG